MARRPTSTPTVALTEADLADIERRLLEQQADLRERVTGFAARPERGSNLGFGKRIGDGTIEAVDRLNTIGVGHALEHKLERTDRALASLADGTYGVCDRCGDPIAPARLVAMPESTTCVTCAAKQ